MAFDPRDKLVPKHPTPLAGVPSVGHLTPVDMEVVRENESTLEGIDRRSRETKNTTLETINRIEAVRKETRDDVRKVDAKIDGVIAVVSDLRVEVGKHGTQNELILERLAEIKSHAERSEQVKTITRIAEVEVDTTRQLTDIEVGKKRAITNIDVDAAAANAKRDADAATAAVKREVFREFMLKVVIATLGGGGVVLLAYLSKTC